MQDFINQPWQRVLPWIPDNFFGLAIVDPPYGIGISSNPIRQAHEKKTWDNEIPGPEYFEELFRVSENQIIWGGNYFLDHLPPSQGFIVWDKVQPEKFSLAMCEFAWLSIQAPAKLFRRHVLKERNKIHPTQKPVALYSWLLDLYATPGRPILDTHAGSASSLIACIEKGFDFLACEVDPVYYRDATERIKQSKLQKKLFSGKANAKSEQATLFKQ